MGWKERQGERRWREKEEGRKGEGVEGEWDGERKGIKEIGREGGRERWGRGNEREREEKRKRRIKGDR